MSVVLVVCASAEEEIRAEDEREEGPEGPLFSTKIVYTEERPNPVTLTGKELWEIYRVIDPKVRRTSSNRKSIGHD